jgi:hypothetical protein
MKAFGDGLYVGTLNKRSLGSLLDLEVRPQLFPLTLGKDPSSGVVTGTQIWRYDGSSWTAVVPDGFGSKRNEGTRSFAVFDGALYAGTLNQAAGCEVWRSTDGFSWSQVARRGFGTPANESVRGMTVWRNALWVGTLNSRGGELWKYDGSAWTQVAKRGITDPDNATIAELTVFQDQLYVGAWNQKGARMYRYDGATWTDLVGGAAATPAGFGDPATGGFFTIVEFHGGLYATTFNFDRGFSVWRSLDQGLSWQAVVIDGLGDVRQRYGWRLVVHDDRLILGTFVMGDSGPDQYKLGGRLYASTDGVTWTEEVGPHGELVGAGFGDGLNYGVRALESFSGDLYIGTAQCFFCSFPITGAEVWRHDSASCGW